VLLVALLLVVFLVGLPIMVFILARHGHTLRIASALVAIGVGVGLGALAFVPASSLPDLPLLGAAVELLLLAMFAQWRNHAVNADASRWHCEPVLRVAG